jgi:hypothetical protein
MEQISSSEASRLSDSQEIRPHVMKSEGSQHPATRPCRESDQCSLCPSPTS